MGPEHSHMQAPLMVILAIDMKMEGEERRRSFLSCNEHGREEIEEGIGWVGF